LLSERKYLLKKEVMICLTPIKKMGRMKKGGMKLVPQRWNWGKKIIAGAQSVKNIFLKTQIFVLSAAPTKRLLMFRKRKKGDKVSCQKPQKI
jgi:hypothetical protein